MNWNQELFFPTEAVCLVSVKVIYFRLSKCNQKYRDYFSINEKCAYFHKDICPIHLKIKAINFKLSASVHHTGMLLFTREQKQK